MPDPKPTPASPVALLGGVLGALALAAASCGGVFLWWRAQVVPAGVVAPPRVDAAPVKEPISPVAGAPRSAAEVTEVDDSVARIRARGLLRVGMDTGEPPWTGTPPMYFRNGEGKDDGFDYVVAQVIAEALGVQRVEIVHGKYSELPAMLAAPDTIDVLISGYSPSDEAGITWSAPYLEYGLCLVVTAKSKAQTTADLWGKAVGIFDDEAAAEDVQKLVKGYTELVRLEDGYWDQLLTGRFEGFIYDYPYAVAEINDFYKRNPHRAGAFRIAQFNLTDSEYAVGLRAGEGDLLAKVNAAILAWRETEAYGGAMRAYLSSALAAPTAPSTARVVVVKKGDTLSGIAGRELGDMGKWKEIWGLNKARFPSPHLIEVGDQVILP
jgi:ABC-type amino acid transport substrate-binding protein